MRGGSDDCDRYVVIGSDDGSAHIWSFGDKGAALKATMRHGGNDEGSGVTSVSFSPPGKSEREAHEGRGGDRSKPVPHRQVLTSSKDCTARIWDMSGELVQSFPREPPAVLPGQHHEEDHRHRHQQQQPVVYEGHTNYVNMASWQGSAAERPGMRTQQILTCSDDKRAIIWDATEGRPLRVLHDDSLGHSASVVMAHWQSSDATRVLTCSHDRTCMLWNARDGKCLQQIPRVGHDQHEGPIWSAYFNPDATEVLTASRDGTAKIWDLAHGGQCKSTLRAHKEMLFGARYNPREAEKEVITYGLDNTARIWDRREGQREAIRLDKHTGCVWQASFSWGDGSRILTCSHDMTAMVWDKKNPTREKYTLAGHTGILWHAAFSHDDQWVLTCSEDRTAKVWNIFPGSTRRPQCHTLVDKRSKGAVTCGEFLEAKPVEAPS